MPALSGPAASSGANRNSLDYNKVIRGFTAAAKQHTKAAFVPPPADAIEAILLELSKPKKDRVDILATINLARPYTPKVAMARFTLGVDVVYHSHRAVIPGTGCHTNAWRIYFSDAAIPDQLRINGEPINQIKYQRFDYRVYFKVTKGTPFHGINGVSSHCVDIEVKRPHEEAPDDQTVNTPGPKSSVIGNAITVTSKKAKKGTKPMQPNKNVALTESITSEIPPPLRQFDSTLQQSIRPENSTGAIGPVTSEYESVFEDDAEAGIDTEDTFMDNNQSVEVDETQGTDSLTAKTTGGICDAEFL
ncbi:hypothetical protein H257_16662 [Aphanomyces astaci]|uniref:Uncharacterized protein n=1 Tax=Aphanomyces astaci TaxID=112090 RepID=W4FJV0_APHAT|nr:hypothetical protein H257_16662 [Aphanomyces astaci]ETV67121.1 hypothetical protein H257_16662 [Aphanomyces astaci]|eukprot:XP_009843490.1 hypothetical protein H257_16662 [Aphanomyces astaci]